MGAGKGKTRRTQVSVSRRKNSKKRVLDDGTIEYRLKNGDLHRENGPAVEDAGGSKEWWLRGRLHRLNGPAIERADGHKSWWAHGKRHRVDGPAVEFAGGSKEWWLRGRLHRLNGPAIERADGHKSWWVHGKRHRVDGPAVEFADGSKEWWISGDELSEEEWAAVTTENSNHSQLAPTSKKEKKIQNIIDNAKKQREEAKNAPRGQGNWVDGYDVLKEIEEVLNEEEK